MGAVVKHEIGWEDPGQHEGELAWSARFADAEILLSRRRAYMWAGQYQQRPEPRGGGIFKRDWWQIWDEATGASYGVSKSRFPPLRM